LTTPQIPSHSHTVQPSPGGAVFGNSCPNPFPAGFGNNHINKVAMGPQSIFDMGTTGTGGGSDHTHPFSFSSGSGTFSGNAINLAVKYYDFIIATAN
jgi:hypothetical protein